MENSNNINKENIKIKRIGRLSFGIILILIGIIVLAQTFFPFTLLRYVLVLWPLIFVSLGIEVLYYTNKENIQIKYDFLGIILIFILLFNATLFSIGNYAVNKILYNTDIQNSIIEASKQNTYNYHIDKLNKLSNLSNKPVNIIIQPTTEKETLINIAINYTNRSFSNILAQELSNFPNSSIIDTNELIIIQNLPDYIESLDILIISNTPENIVFENCIIK